MIEIISDSNQLDVRRKYPYADYLTWRFDQMVEIIKGKVFKNVTHSGQRASGESWESIWAFVDVLPKEAMQSLYCTL